MSSAVAKPHILMLTHDRRIDRRILLQARSLIQHGVKVTVLAMPANENEILQDDDFIVRLKLNSNIKSRFFNKTIFQFDRFIRQLVGNGNFLRLLLRSYFWRLYKNPEAYFKSLFLQQALAIKADIYVAHDLPLLPVAHACAKHFSAKLVYDSHELYCEQEFTAQEKKLWMAIESRYIHDCDKVITINASIAKEIANRYQLKQVDVIHNAEQYLENWEPDDISLKRKLNLKADDILLLYQGSMTEQHNLKILIDAIALVNNEKVHLLFLGDGPYVNKLKKYVKRRGLQYRVHHHPAVPQHELIEYTTSADVGLIPYLPNCLNNYLCTPNKLFEYIAAGLPIVANDLPELRKFVHDNQIGLVGNAASINDIVNLIYAVLKNSYYSQLKQNVLYLRRNLNWAVESKKLIRIYDALI